MSPKLPKRRKKAEETEDEAALAADTAAAAPAEAPATDAETADTPASDAETADTPASDAETTDTPASDTETADAPAADVERTETPRAEKIAATDAVDDAPEADEAATPPAPAPEPARKPTGPAGAAKRRATGKVARDKHGRPVVDGPVVQAHAKYVRTSARKARLVCDHIRGKSVDEAVAILAHTPRAVAEDWEKLLKSAVANAEHNHELLGDDLRILAVFADEGPTLKRFRPRAMGRARPIHKRTSHLTIQLTPKEQ